MKLTKSIPAALIGAALLVSGINAAADGIPLKHSQHKAIPDTSSTLQLTADDIKADLSITDMSILMGNGINLGNTMEAYRDVNDGTKKDPTFYEQRWGQPLTTEKLMKTYKQFGFDTLRIPVAWTNAMDYEEGDYTIRTAYLDRVETIVRWALKYDITVIINDHWDGGWWGMFGSNTPATVDDAWELYTAMWTQIATRFKNYGYKVIFEGGNEEVGSRLNDTNICGDSGKLDENGCYEMGNKINQKFVDIVRGTGGNNANRFLLIPGYNTDISKTVDSRFKMPSDSAKGKLFVSVHYYDPSNFTLADADLWGTKKDLSAMQASFDKLTRFTDEGYGVIVGEYGALPNTDGSKKSGADVFTLGVLNNCDRLNVVPVLWDCNGFFKKSGKMGIADAGLKKIFATKSYKGQKEAKVPYEKIVFAAEDALDDMIINAPDVLSDNPAAIAVKSGKSVAWIMYTSSNWGCQYSVGDVYNPDAKSKGLVAKDVIIDGEGDYTVSIDFSETVNNKGISFAFSALGIANGEANYPGWVITLKSVKVDGKEYKLTKEGFTTSDDGKTTRHNLYNEWVTVDPSTIKGARANGGLKGKSASPLNKSDPAFQAMKTLEITFHYGPAAE